MVEEINKDFYKKISDFLNQRREEQIDWKTLNLDSIKPIYDGYLCNTFSDKENPNYTEEMLHTFAKLKLYLNYRVKTKDDLANKLSVSTMFGDILSKITNKINNTDTKLKAAFFNAHDDNIVFMLAYLVEFGSIDQDKLLIPFATNLIFELHNISNKYFVKIFYNDEPLKIKQCANTVCSLDEFSGMLSATVFKDFNKTCNEGIL